MENDIEKYLEILYPEPKGRNTEQYKKDKEFLGKYLSQFESIYKKYEKSRGKFSENKFYNMILSIAKEKYDPETKIINFARAMLETLETNDIFMQKFDVLITILNNEQLKSENKENKKDKDITTISIDHVYELVNDFLEEIEPEANMAWEFEYLQNYGKIELISPDDETNSHYAHKEGKIYYKFDGTVNTANTLIHEFMHHISFQEAQTNMGYNEFTLFREFLSIYYEKAFIEFMNQKGVISKEEKETLVSKRITNQNEKDTNHCLSMYLELSHKLTEKKNLDRNDILEVAKKYFPDRTSEKLWEVSSEMLLNFAKEHFSGMEVAAGLTTYLFSTAMAYETTTDKNMLSKMFKLAGDIKDGKNDVQTLEKYFELVGEKEQEFINRLCNYENNIISTNQIGIRVAKANGIVLESDAFEREVRSWGEKGRGENEH